jgi:hypothetical protein
MFNPRCPLHGNHPIKTKTAEPPASEPPAFDNSPKLLSRQLREAYAEIAHQKANYEELKRECESRLRQAASSHTELRARLQMLAKYWRSQKQVSSREDGYECGRANMLVHCAAALEAALGEPQAHSHDEG